MKVKEIMSKYELKDEKRVAKALDNIKSGKVYLYSMSGKMGSGKDTVGNAIAKDLEYGNKVIQTSFATELRKEIERIINRVRNDELLGVIAKDEHVSLGELRTLIYHLGKDSIYDRTPGSRKAIQYWGTDVRRNQNENYWVNKVAQFVVDNASNGRSVYVTDSRFPNEAQSIVDLGGVVIRLDVPDDVRIDRISYRDGNTPSMSQLMHVSETALDEFDFEFLVDGCLTPEEIANLSIEYLKAKR